MVAKKPRQIAVIYQQAPDISPAEVAQCLGRIHDILYDNTPHDPSYYRFCRAVGQVTLRMAEQEMETRRAAAMAKVGAITARSEANSDLRG